MVFLLVTLVKLYGMQEKTGTTYSCIWYCQRIWKLLILQGQLSQLSRLKDLQVEIHTTAPDICDDIAVKDVSFDSAKCMEIKKKTAVITVCLRKLEMRDRSVFTPDGCIPSKRSQLGQYSKHDLWLRDLSSWKCQSYKRTLTCAIESLWMLVAVICLKQWTLNSIDIKSAFLQEKQISHAIYSISDHDLKWSKGQYGRSTGVCMVWLMLDFTGINK